MGLEAAVIEAVIFDVDGTLVDSNDAHARAFVEAFADCGFDVPFEKVRRLIGKGSDKLIPELIGRFDQRVADRKKAIFRQRFLPALQPFGGVGKLLRTLHERGIRLAVASSAGKDELDALLAVTGVAELLEQQTDADDAEHSKPDPDIVRAALQKLALPAPGCVMVGDTPYDAEAARRAGVGFVGVRCGGWTDRDLAPALAVYDDPAALLGQLDQLARRVAVP